MNPAIQSVIDAVDKSQSVTVKRKALAGSIQAFRILWQQNTGERTHFTDKDLGNVRQLIEWYGAKETLALSEWAIENWNYLRGLPYLSQITPTPVFSAFFYNRDKIRSAMEGQRKIAERPMIVVPEPPKEETGATKKSLLEMFLKQRKEK